METLPLRYEPTVCTRPNTFRFERGEHLWLHALVRLNEASPLVAITVAVDTEDIRRRAQLHRQGSELWMLNKACYHPMLPPIAFLLLGVPEGTL